jgi:hypothetical protein
VSFYILRHSQKCLKTGSSRPKNVINGQWQLYAPQAVFREKRLAVVMSAIHPVLVVGKLK